MLNGCRYGTFTGEALTADERNEWLGRQDPSRFKQHFRPQPYERCAKVFREMGFSDDARTILVKKEKRLRRSRRRRAGWAARSLMLLRDGALCLFVCYGLKPLRAIWFLVALWLAGSGAFWVKYHDGQFKPNNASLLRSSEWYNCSASHAKPIKYLGSTNYHSQLDCFPAQPEAQRLPALDAPVYAFDVLFPLVQVEQQVHWVPDDDQALGRRAKWLVYFMIVMGWLLSLLTVAGLAGIIKVIELVPKTVPAPHIADLWLTNFKQSC